MTPEETLMSLAAAARRESPPVVDVTDKVARILARPIVAPAISSARPLAWVAAASSVAAAIAIIVALHMSGSADSVSIIANSISWVTQ